MMPTRRGRLVCWVEVENGDGRTAVVEEAEVLALEAGDEAALLVGDGEDEVDLVGLNLDGGDGLVAGGGQAAIGGLLWSGRRSGLRGRLGRLNGGLGRGLRGCGGCRRSGCRRRWLWDRSTGKRIQLQLRVERRGGECNDERESPGQPKERTGGSINCGHWFDSTQSLLELARNCCEKRFQLGREGSLDLHAFLTLGMGEGEPGGVKEVSVEREGVFVSLPMTWGAP